MMELNKVEGIDRNMDMQNKYVKEILDLITECEKNEVTDNVSDIELKQLREHCEDIAMAANTAKKLVANLMPLAKDADTQKKAKEKAEQEAKKKAEAAKKRAETKAKKKAEAAEAAKAEAAEAEATEAEDEAEGDDDDLDFLG